MEKFAILKADDFRFDGSIKKFFRFIFLCQSMGATASVGVIARTVQYGRQADIDLLRELSRSGKVEVWNHSMDHADLTSLSPAALADSIAISQQILGEILGSVPKAYGAPFNRVNDQVFSALKSQGIKYCYEELFDKRDYMTPERNVSLDGQPNFESFKERVTSSIRKGLSRMVVQLHPPRWTDQGFVEFEKCLRFLLENDFRIRTLEQMAHRQADRMLGEGHRESFELAVKLQTFWAGRAEKYNSTLSNFNSYFLARFTANYLDIVDLIESMSILYDPKCVVDVGSGLGQWGLSGLACGSVEQVHLFDTNRTICEALEEGKRETGAGQLIVHAEDFLKSTSVERESADIIFCANALNYMDLAEFAAKCEEVAKRGAYLIILNQTDAFNRIGLEDYLKAGDVETAAERGLTTLRSMLAKLGFIGYLGTRTTPDYKELQAAMFVNGFTLYDSFVPVWERKYKGEPTFQGYIFHRNLFTPEDKTPPAKDRAQFRKLLITGGCSNLDEALFAKNVDDYTTDAELKVVATRACRIKRSWLSFGVENDTKIAESLAEGDHAAIIKLLLKERTPKPEHILAGCASAAILKEPSAYAKIQAKFEESNTEPNMRKLVSTLGYLLQKDLEGARREYLEKV